MSTSTWAQTADVLSLTGATVTDAAVVQANAVVEMHAGRLWAVAAATTGTSDTEWMRRATAYQAAWMATQPDLYGRVDFTQVDLGARPVGITETAMTLAPLARVALRRVSWLKTRSLHVRAPFEDSPGPSGLVDDSSLSWTPMGAA